MTLVVENGTGLPNANSYVSLAEANAYFALFGNTDWYPDEAALITATQALDLLWQDRFASRPLTIVQTLKWPREPFTAMDGVERSGVPVEVKKATMELALLHLTGTTLIRDPDQESQLQEITEKVGDLEVSRRFHHPISKSKLTKVGLLLRPVLRPGSGMGALRVIRA